MHTNDRAELLPDAPLAQIAHEHRNVVDPDLERPLDRHEDVSRLVRREERLDVEDPFADVLGAPGVTAVLVRLEAMGGAPTNRVGWPRRRPGPWLLGAKRSAAVRRGATSERPGKHEVLRATEPLRLGGLVGVTGRFGRVEGLGARPLDKLGDRAPSERTWRRDHRLDGGPVTLEEPRDGAAQREQVVRRVPGDE